FLSACAQNREGGNSERVDHRLGVGGLQLDGRQVQSGTGMGGGEQQAGILGRGQHGFCRADLGTSQSLVPAINRTDSPAPTWVVALLDGVGVFLDGVGDGGQGRNVLAKGGNDQSRSRVGTGQGRGIGRI